MFGCGVFLVTALLNNVEISMGFAFGLFAIFSMLRYRTETLTVRDMTYLFILIAMSLMAAVSNMSVVGLLAVNTFLCGLTAFCESHLFAPQGVTSKTINYEKIELITPDRHTDLIDDLECRLGYPIERIEIGAIDFLKDTAKIKIYYNEDKAGAEQRDEFSKFKLYNQKR